MKILDQKMLEQQGEINSLRAERDALVKRVRAQVAEEVAAAIEARLAAMPKVDERGWPVDATVRMAWIPALAREHAEAPERFEEIHGGTPK